MDHPADARPMPVAVHALEELRTHLGCVAILSGRPLDFLTTLVPTGVDLAGLNGLQRRVRGVVVEDPRVRVFAPIVVEAARELERLLPGTLVERKSNISVAVHWRMTHSLGDRVGRVARSLAERHGLVVQEGRMMIELRPAIPIDKGVVSAELVRTFDHVAYIGDDATDLVAFEALSDLRRRGSIRSLMLVAVSNDEAPQALTRLADVEVNSPRGVAEFLVALADALGR